MRVGDESRRGARARALLLLLRLRSRRVIAEDDVFVRALFPHQTRVQYGYLVRRVVHLLSVLDAATDVGRGVSRADGRGGARRPGPRRRTQWARSRIRRRARRRAGDARGVRGALEGGGRRGSSGSGLVGARAGVGGRGRGRGRAPRLWQRHRARGGSEPGGRVDERWGSRASKGPRGQARGAGRRRRCEARTREPGTPSDTGGRPVRSVHHRTTAVSQRHGVPTQRSDASAHTLMRLDA